MRIGRHGFLDPEREERTGVPEAILAEGKSDEFLVSLIEGQVKLTGRAIVTRLDPARVAVLDSFAGHRYDARARMAVMGPDAAANGGRIAILAAGTSDDGVVEEAAITARALGCDVHVQMDVGVAGPHRIEVALEELPWRPDVLIAVAGREAALATVLAGRVSCPVIGVPTSTGYGAGGEGLAALYGLLQACAPLAVVNIDAGFVAAAVAVQIAKGAASGRTVPAEVPYA